MGETFLMAAYFPKELKVCGQGHKKKKKKKTSDGRKCCMNICDQDVLYQ